MGLDEHKMMRRRSSKHLVELEGDDDAEAEREPEGRVEQEEGLRPALAPVRRQPRAPPPRAAAPGLRPRPPRSCERGEENPVRYAKGRARARPARQARYAPAIGGLVPLAPPSRRSQDAGRGMGSSRSRGAAACGRLSPVGLRAASGSVSGSGGGGRGQEASEF